MRSPLKRISRLASPSCRHLLASLVRAGFKATDQNSILGKAWSLIMPLFFTVVMYFLFRNRFAIGENSYILFIMVGVSTVGFFLNATTAMIAVFQVNRDLILNTSMPREILFLATMSSALVKYLLELLMAFAGALFLASPIWSAIPLVIPLIAGLCALTVGVGLIMGMLACVTRDINYLWVLVSRVLLFATPVFYPLQRLSPISAKVVYFLNPLSPFLVAMRKIILGKTPDALLPAYVQSVAIGFSVLIIGYLIFIRYENAAVERA